MTTIEINKHHHKNYVLFEDAVNDYEILLKANPRRTIQIFFHGKLQKRYNHVVETTKPVKPSPSYV